MQTEFCNVPHKSTPVVNEQLRRERFVTRIASWIACKCASVWHIVFKTFARCSTDSKSATWGSNSPTRTINTYWQVRNLRQNTSAKITTRRFTSRYTVESDISHRIPGIIIELQKIQFKNVNLLERIISENTMCQCNKITKFGADVSIESLKFHRPVHISCAWVLVRCSTYHNKD